MSKKDAFYLSHDSNARNDPKVIKLRRKLGSAGYGCFWMIVECLRDQSDYELPLSIIPDLAYEMHESEDLFMSVVNDFELFVIENERFYSARLKRSMEMFNEKRAKRSEAGKKGNAKRWPDRNATNETSQCDRNATNELSQSDDILSQENESKSSKESESKSHLPSLDILSSYFSSKTSWDKKFINTKAKKFLVLYSNANSQFDWKMKVDEWLLTEKETSNITSDLVPKKPTPTEKYNQRAIPQQNGN